MTNFTVKVILDAPAVGLHREAERNVFIPPDYGLDDIIHLYAVSLEKVVGDLVDSEGWRQPLRHALQANDARASRIEELASSSVSVHSDVILAVLNTPSQDAIDLWGSPDIEG